VTQFQGHEFKPNVGHGAYFKKKKKKKRRRHRIYPSPFVYQGRACENITRKRALTKNSTTMALWPQNSSLQNCEK